MTNLISTPVTHKVCRVCHQTKPISEYYLADRFTGRYYNKCKECQCAHCARNKEENKKLISLAP